MDQQDANHLLEQAFELWFGPEIQRRKSSGQLPNNFSVWAAQVIMDLELEKPIIRLNEEVHGIIKGVAKRAITKGEDVTLDALQSIDGMSLTEEFPNAGHLTTLLIKENTWQIFFDFQYNAGRIKIQLSSVDQFLKVAHFCIESNLPIAAIDNLYDAVQIMAKCFLLVMPDKRVLKSSTHGFIERVFNFQGKIGNVSVDSVQLLKRLVQLRPKTRYAFDPLDVSSEELKKLYESARFMRNEIEARRPKRFY